MFLGLRGFVHIHNTFLVEWLNWRGQSPRQTELIAQALTTILVYSDREISDRRQNLEAKVWFTHKAGYGPFWRRKLNKTFLLLMTWSLTP